MFNLKYHVHNNNYLNTIKYSDKLSESKLQNYVTCII